MKLFKIRYFIKLSLFISQYNFVHSYQIQGDFNHLKSCTANILLSGWKPRNTLIKK